MSLHDLQTKVHVAKEHKNEFGGYNYRTAEGILSAVKAALPPGASIIVTDEIREVAGQIFVSSTAIVTFADGTSHQATGHAMHALQKKGMDASQITGSASSYARKYALGGLLALDDGSVDPDAGQHDEPEFNHAAVCDRIKAALERANTLPRLGDIWKGDADILKRIKAEKPPMYAELEALKDARKRHLTPNDKAMQGPDIGDGYKDGAYQ